MPYVKSGNWKFFAGLAESDPAVWSSINSSSYAVADNFELEAIEYTMPTGSTELFYCSPCYLLPSSAAALNGSKGQRLTCYNTAPSSLYNRGSPASSNLRTCYRKTSLMIPLAMQIIAMATSDKFESWMWAPDGSFDSTLELNSLSATENPQYFFESLNAVNSYWTNAAFYCTEHVGDPAALAACWDDLPASKLKTDALWLHMPSPASRVLTRACVAPGHSACPATQTSQDSGFDTERIAEWLAHQGYVDTVLWITYSSVEQTTQVTLEDGQVLYRVALWYEVFLWVMTCLILVGQILEVLLHTASFTCGCMGIEGAVTVASPEPGTSRISDDTTVHQISTWKRFLRKSASMRYPYETVKLCRDQRLGGTVRPDDVLTTCPCFVVVLGLTTGDKVLVGIRCVVLCLLFAASLGLPTAVSNFEWIILDLWYNDPPWNTLLIVLLGYMSVFTPLSDLQQGARPLIEWLHPRAIGRFGGSNFQLHGYLFWPLVWTAFWTVYISINYSRLRKDQFDLVQALLVSTSLFGYALLVCMMIFSSVRIRKLIGDDSSERDEDGPDYNEYQVMQWSQRLTGPIAMGFDKIEVRSWMKYLDIKSGKGLSLVELHDSAVSAKHPPRIEFMHQSLPGGHGVIAGGDARLGVVMLRQLQDFSYYKKLPRSTHCTFNIDLDADAGLFNALSMTGF